MTTTGVDALDVGACINIPTGDTFSAVDNTGCDEPHEAEVVTIMARALK